jgi:phosphodiesterase/alkaline phosphatase D-like protein
MNAVRAYFEWMPIRQVDMDDNLRIWRSFALGKLVDLVSVYLSGNSFALQQATNNSIDNAGHSQL